MPIAFDREDKKIPITGSGVAAPAGGIAIGGKHEGTIVVGNGKVVEVKTNKATQDLAELADELDNETYKKTAKDFTEEKLAEILEKLKLIKDIYPTSFQDIMERLGYKVEDVEINVVNTGTGAVATGGEVKAGQGGTVIPGNFKGNIVVGKNNRFK